MADQQIVLGWPVDERLREILRQFNPLPVVVPGSVQTRCAACGVTVWIGPRQHQWVTANPSLRVCCVMCLVVTSGSTDMETISLGNPDSKIEGE